MHAYMKISIQKPIALKVIVSIAKRINEWFTSFHPSEIEDKVHNTRNR